MWKHDKTFADVYLPQIIDIVRSIAYDVVDVRIANDREDQQEATDYLMLDTSSGRIACRLRREGYRQYSDVTIRSWRASGMPTELDKLGGRTARWYLYGWTDGKQISRWLVWDIWKALDAGLLDTERRETLNRDRQTAFIVIDVSELDAAGAVLRRWGI